MAHHVSKGELDFSLGERLYTKVLKDSFPLFVWPLLHMSNHDLLKIHAPHCVKCVQIRIRKNSVFGHFSRKAIYYAFWKKKIVG